MTIAYDIAGIVFILGTVALRGMGIRWLWSAIGMGLSTIIALAIYLAAPG